VLVIVPLTLGYADASRHRAASMKDPKPAPSSRREFLIMSGIASLGLVLSACGFKPTSIAPPIFTDAPAPTGTPTVAASSTSATTPTLITTPPPTTTPTLILTATTTFTATPRPSVTPRPARIVFKTSPDCFRDGRTTVSGYCLRRCGVARIGGQITPGCSRRCSAGAPRAPEPERWAA